MAVLFVNLNLERVESCSLFRSLLKADLGQPQLLLKKTWKKRSVFDQIIKFS